MRGIKELINIHHAFSRIGFVGTGTMFNALMGGIQDYLDRSRYLAYSPSAAAGQRLISHPIAGDIRTAVEGKDLIVYLAKPVNFKPIMTEIAPYIGDNTVFMSVAAGISIDQIEPYCKYVLRCMPNVMVKDRQGITGVCYTPNLPEIQLQTLMSMLGTLGKVVPLANQNDMHAFTVIFASGPAIVCKFLEWMVTAAHHHDLMSHEPALLKKYLIFMLRATADYLENHDLSPQDMRKLITSEKGTTAATCTKFEELDLEQLFVQAINAGITRSKEMGAFVLPTPISTLSVFKAETVVADASAERNTKKFGA